MKIFTIGHSNHTIETFIELLHQHQVTALADVRSSPYSRRFPQFNQSALKTALKTANIAYVPLGDNLGERSLTSSKNQGSFLFAPFPSYLGLRFTTVPFWT